MHGETIINERKKTALILSERAEKKILEIFPDYNSFSITYKNPHIDKKCIRESIEESLNTQKRQEDIFKTTISGPHRDEYIFLLNGSNMKYYSSQGEKRICALMLKISLIEYLAEERGLFPIIIFDDILLEMDKIYMDSTLRQISMQNQVFFTATEIPDISFFTASQKSFFLNVSKDKGVTYGIQ